MEIDENSLEYKALLDLKSNETQPFNLPNQWGGFPEFLISHDLVIFMDYPTVGTKPSVS